MKYRMREIFASLQGEGRNMGRPATFIRLAGCNLNCPWCDTRRQVKEMLTISQIVQKVRLLKNRSVIVTGGEPTIAPDIGELLTALKDEGCWLALETNGLKNIPELELFDYVSVSPKWFYRSRYISGENLVTKADEVRIVAENEQMESFCVKMRELISATDYFVSPLEENGKIHYRRACNLLSKLNRKGKNDVWPPWSLSIQMHKVLGIK